MIMNTFDIEKLQNILLQFRISMAFDVLNCLNPEDKVKPFLTVIDEIPARTPQVFIPNFRFKASCLGLRCLFEYNRLRRNFKSSLRLPAQWQ
jgi:hypothetical protein